jgi:hypothetical protein
MTAPEIGSPLASFAKVAELKPNSVRKSVLVKSLSTKSLKSGL